MKDFVFIGSVIVKDTGALEVTAYVDDNTQTRCCIFDKMLTDLLN